MDWINRYFGDYAWTFWLIIGIFVFIIVLLVWLIVAGRRQRNVRETVYDSRIKPYINRKYKGLEYFPNSGISMEDFACIKHFYVNNYFVSGNGIVGKFGDGRDFRYCQVYTSEQDPKPKLGFTAVTTFNSGGNGGNSLGGGVVVVPSPQGRAYGGSLFVFDGVKRSLVDVVVVSEDVSGVCFNNGGYYGVRRVDVGLDGFEVYSESVDEAVRVVDDAFKDRVRALSGVVGSLMVVVGNECTYVMLVNKDLIEVPKVSLVAGFRDEKYFRQLDANLQGIEIVGNSGL